MVKVPRRSRVRRLVALFSAAAFLLSPALLHAFHHHLSEEDVREAYFFGQHHDLRVGKFFDAYEKPFRHAAHDPAVRAIGVRTPYSAAVLRSYKAGNTFSAQRAWQDYTERPQVFEVVVWIDVPLAAAQQTYVLNSAGTFLKMFAVKLSSQERIVDPRKTLVIPQYLARGDSSVLSGAEMHFEYDVQEVASAVASIQVTSQTGKIVAASFDLAALR